MGPFSQPTLGASWCGRQDFLAHLKDGAVEAAATSAADQANHPAADVEP
jgi:hypothetical protein